MSLTAKQESSNHELIPQGLHVGICTAIIDLGTQEGYEGRPTRKVLITWELPDVRIETPDRENEGKTLDRPKVCSREFTLSLNAKAHLFKILTSWRGRAFTQEELNGFDIEKILGVGCQIQIIHTDKGDKTWANIENVLPAPKGFKADPENDPVKFSFEGGGEIILPDVPEWIENKIRASEEWRKSEAGGFDGSQADSDAPADDIDEDVPF